ncbi:shootin-1-like [Xenopus tropicalis]|uniref:Shootin-1-like n=1 Tax=Xenopus tropicalis TaxID=8364 RepID=A0A8J1JT35_XENTR|nr:shootin-1-like [Xenopus tropicalis]
MFHFPLLAIQEFSDTDSLPDSETEEEELEKEREDAIKKLEEFKNISERLLAELSMLEDEFEIEKTCRAQAEVYASKVQKENQKLKRISMQVIPMLHELPGEILSQNCQEPPSATDSASDTEYEYQQQIKYLQETINKLLEEKKQATVEVEELKCQIRALNKKMEEERLERNSLVVSLEQNQGMLLQLTKASLKVSQEYKEMMQQLELEQDLRHKAELFAHKMLREQQAVSRQSSILMQNAEPSMMLLKALDEVGSLTAALEETKHDLQAKIQDLESQLEERPLQSEFELLQGDLKVTKEEKSQLEKKLEASEEKQTILEQKGQYTWIGALEEKLREAECTCLKEEEQKPDPVPVPPPPPPPLPHCLSGKAPENPLDLIKQRRGSKAAGENPSKSCDDIKADAVKEMMDRIKNGVILRSAQKDKQSQSAAAIKRKSVISELHVILEDTMKKPARKASRRRSRKVNESELESVLMRRRRIVDIPQVTGGGTDSHSNPPGKDESKPPIAPWSNENSPVLVKLRQRTNELQRSRRKVF